MIDAVFNFSSFGVPIVYFFGNLIYASLMFSIPLDRRLRRFSLWLAMASLLFAATSLIGFGFSMWGWWSTVANAPLIYAGLKFVQAMAGVAGCFVMLIGAVLLRRSLISLCNGKQSGEL